MGNGVLRLPSRWNTIRRGTWLFRLVAGTVLSLREGRRMGRAVPGLCGPYMALSCWGGGPFLTGLGGSGRVWVGRNPLQSLDIRSVCGVIGKAFNP